MCIDGECVVDDRAIYEPNFKFIDLQKLPGKQHDRESHCKVRGMRLSKWKSVCFILLN